MGWLLGVAFGAGAWLSLSGLEARHLWGRPRAPKPAHPRSWPAFFDDVASGLRAGLALGPALWQAGRRLPQLERVAFEQAQIAWQSGGGLVPCLDALAVQLNVRSLSSLVELVRLTSEQGSSRLPALVSELAEQTRSQLMLVDEVQGRQATTVNAAKVAVAAPWVVLALTSSRADVRAVYLTPTGGLVLAAVAAVCALAYLSMQRLARIEALEVWR